MTLVPMDTYGVDRTFLSRYSSGPLLLRVLDDFGEPTVADGEVSFVLTTEVDPVIETEVLTASQVDHDGITDYRVDLPSRLTSKPGYYTGRWQYLANAVERINEQGIEVGPASPNYDRLSPGMKDVVESIWLRMSDMFDSPMGGPHLQVYVQSRFSRNTVAGLLRLAINRINAYVQSFATVSIEKFPLAKWSGLIETALWVEVIKHMRRSYAEQPDVVGANGVSRLDRNRYMQVWGDLLRDEEADLRLILDKFKMASMNLGGGSVLVAGGIYPRVSVGTAGFGPLAAPRGLFYGR